MPVEPEAHPVTRYAQDVVSGKIIAGRLVRLACERHLRDLETADAQGIYFDEEAANRALGFCTLVRHSKGEWAGTEFKPEPWQVFCRGSVFGWKRVKDGTRRFRKSYREVARKNGKSTDEAITGLYMTFSDGEAGAECFTAATKRDQARIIHEEAIRMVKSSPHLKRQIKIFKDNLNDPKTNSKFEPLGADEDTMDGLNIHCATADELHAHKRRDLFDKLDTATGARRQPLISAITTAGAERSGICWNERQHAVNVLEGRVDDPGLFAYIATLDDKDDWRDETVWIKANPNLGVSVKLDDLRAKVNKAMNDPSAINSVLRYHMNQWVGTAADPLIEMDRWDQCGGKFDSASLIGRPCRGGLDLGETNDLSSFTLCFPPALDDPYWYYLWWFWAPYDDGKSREKHLGDRLRQWGAEGIIELTEGDTTDYDLIGDKILELNELYEFGEMAYDQWNAGNIPARLQKAGIELERMTNSYSCWSEPTKRFIELVKNLKVRHGDNKVATWMAANARRVETVLDTVTVIRPSKSKSVGKIDGVISGIAATKRAILIAGTETGFNDDDYELAAAKL